MLHIPRASSARHPDHARVNSRVRSARTRRRLDGGDVGHARLHGLAHARVPRADAAVRPGQRARERTRPHAAIVAPIVQGFVVRQRHRRIGRVVHARSAHEPVRLRRMRHAAPCARAFLRLVQRPEQQREEHEVVRERAPAALPATLADGAAQSAVRLVVALALGLAQPFPGGHHVAEHQRTSFRDSSSSARKPPMMASNVSGGSAANVPP